MWKKQRQKQKRHQNNKQAEQNARLIIISYPLSLTACLSLSHTKAWAWRSVFGCGWQHFTLLAPAFAFSFSFYFCALRFSAFLLLCTLYCFDFALFLVTGLFFLACFVFVCVCRCSQSMFNPLMTTCMLRICLAKKKSRLQLFLLLLCSFLKFI